MIRPKLKNFALIFLIFSAAVAGNADLTKREAFEILKTNSFKWHQTEMLTQESAGLKKQAEGADSFHLGFVSREYLARINQVQFGFTETGPLGFISLGETAFQFTMPIIDKVSLARLQAAIENEKMSAATQKQYQSDLTYYMLLTYLNTQRLKRKTLVVDSYLTRDLQILNIAKTRVRVGQGLRVDLLRAQGLYEKDGLKRMDANSSYLKSKQDLATIISKANIEGDLEPLEIHTFISPQSAESLLKHLDLRPDVRAARQMVLVTGNLQSEAEKQTHLKLELMGQVGVFGTTIYGGQNSAVTGTIGVQLAFPILDGGYFSGKVQEVAAKHMTASLQVNQVELEASSQIKTACTQLTDARTVLDASKTYSHVVEEEFRLISNRYSSGATSGLELSNAHVNISSAQESETDAIFTYEVAKVNYYKSIGSFDEYFIQEKVK